MKAIRWTFLFLTVFLLFTCLSCAGSKPKPDIEAQLISAMSSSCKTIEIKVEEDRIIYMITPTGRVSGNGCPLALIRGWKEGSTVKEKEVEVCECRGK